MVLNQAKTKKVGNCNNNRKGRIDEHDFISGILFLFHFNEMKGMNLTLLIGHIDLIDDGLI